MKKILVIDDEPGHRLMVRAVLEDAGWQVTEAGSAEAALRLLENADCPGVADSSPGLISPGVISPGVIFSGAPSLSKAGTAASIARTPPAQDAAAAGASSGPVPDVGSYVAPDVVLLDMHLPGMDGQAALEKIRAGWPDLPVVLLTAFGSVGSAVEAMKKGAFDYLSKPADNDELCAVLQRAWDYSKLLRQQSRQRLNPLASETEPLSQLVGHGGAMRRLRELIQQAGPSEATVLILGESGTGKELIAESLHTISPRGKAPLIKINCAALPADLLESELFGHEKGAFTGAFKDKPGRFLLADGGTIFLDEVGELPQELQAKLLRVLQERTIEPLGGVRSIAVDVRILAATNRDLRREVRAGRFREDLYFRLNVLEIQAPPLREHLEDLPELTSRLLYRLCRKNKKEVRGMAPDFLDALTAYNWPGNVRELENVLERSLILSRGDTLTAGSLPEHVLEVRRGQPQSASTAHSHVDLEQAEHSSSVPQAGFLSGLKSDSHYAAPDGPTSDSRNAAGGNAFAGGSPLSGSADKSGSLGQLEEAEKQALSEALDLHKGHRERTADALGVSRRTLQYKLKKYGLTKR